MKKKILYVFNDCGFFLSHRLPVARAALKNGYDVHIAAPESQYDARISTEGFNFHPIRLSRRSRNVGVESVTLYDLFRLYLRLCPDVVELATIKPVIYGGSLARFMNIPKIVVWMTGLGYMFIAKSRFSAFLCKGIQLIYRFVLNHRNVRVIFENRDDYGLFIQNKIVAPSVALVIRGAGVDMNEFSYSPENNETPIVVLASRLLWDKGVGEFVEAAQILQRKNVAARFILVGDVDVGNPATISKAKIEEWHHSGAVEWWGRCEDMSNIFSRAHIVCLPSYREGLPKVLVEAAASGRAIVSTDTPGCRDVVRNGVNGLLVPVRDAPALAAAIFQLLDDPSLRQCMGVQGRKIAEQEYSVDKVVRATLAIYGEVL